MRKIAILGGGAAAMTAAYWLTNQPDWQEKYELTIYQMGWRLGGKAASGRNPEVCQRNEEHGYHMLFGFYENTFATMRAVYKTLERSPNEPLSEFCALTLEDEKKYPLRYAMKRNDKLFLAQKFNGEMKTIDFKFPMNSRVPGDGTGFPLWKFVDSAFDWLKHFVTDPQYMYAANPKVRLETLSWYQELESHAKLIGVQLNGQQHLPSNGCLLLAGQLVKQLQNKGEVEDTTTTYNYVIRLIRSHLQSLWDNVKDAVDTDWDAYRSWVLQDFVGTNIIGFLQDDIIKNGFDSINHLNYYEWLRQHGTVSEGTEIMLRSVLVKFAYDACFAYAKGDSTSPATDEKPIAGLPNMEAGTMLRGGMRLFLTYKGSVDWLFQAGAGEVLVAPMYQALKKRGVKFKFFHKITRLVVPNGGDTIEAIEIDKQVNLSVGEYNPLILVNGLAAWPDRPHYDQIVEGAELRERNIDLESHWSDWTGTPITLERGADFDDVLLAIPIGALKHITQDLADNSTTWNQMLESVQTVRTFGFQTWMRKSLEQMGWEKGKILTDTGTEPAGMEADASEIIEVENWSTDQKPNNLTFFGGVTPDDPNEPTEPNPSYPPTQKAIVRELAIDFLNKSAGTYWPHAVTEDGFRWDWLVDVVNPDAIGETRFDSQFWKNNICPTERYALSVVGSTKYRRKAGESGFKNLYLAGDWIDNGINAGCMEATVMSGMQASRAISGYPKHVFGEDDFSLFKSNNFIQEGLLNVASTSVNVISSLSNATVEGANGFREEFSSKELTPNSIPKKVGKGLIKGTSRFAKSLTKTFKKSRKDPR